MLYDVLLTSENTSQDIFPLIQKYISTCTDQYKLNKFFEEQASEEVVRTPVYKDLLLLIIKKKHHEILEKLIEEQNIIENDYKGNPRALTKQPETVEELCFQCDI